MGMRMGLITETSLSFHLHIIQIQHIQADWVSSSILQSFYKTYVTMKVIPDYGVMLIYNPLK